MDASLFLIFVGVGLLAGLASGLLGIGGGVLMVPALVLLARLPFGEAVAVSLLTMVFATPWGVLRHRRSGNVGVRAGLVLGATGFVGVFIAYVVGPYLTDRALMLVFAALLVVSAQRLVYGGLPTRRRDVPWLLGLVGLLSGFVAKLFGIGGGIVMVPALVFLGFGMHAAVGTSLLAVWTNAVLSTGLNLIGGIPQWPLAVALVIGSVVGVRLGSAGAVRAHAGLLRRVFGILLVLTATAMAARSLA